MKSGFAAAFVVVLVSQSGLGQELLLGLDNVGYEGANASGPLLFRDVPESELVSVRAKISAQTEGFWSQTGVIARVPNPSGVNPENWQASWSFRPGGDATHQSNQSLAGVEAEENAGGLSADDLMYVRLDNLGGGMFQAFRGSGPDDNNITWTSLDAQTNANLVGQTLQVGIAGGALGALPGSGALYDWAEIITTGDTFRDDFDYTRDLAVEGVLPGGIWTGIANPAVGGFNSQTGPDLGRCLTCNWNVDGNDSLDDIGNWAGDGPVLLSLPGGDDVTAVFGASLVTGPATVYTNTSSLSFETIQIDNAETYILAGAGSITLSSDSGAAAIDVLQGNHEIQVDLVLEDNTTATAAAGAVLDINGQITLNGNTFTTAGAGTVNVNTGTLVGSGGSLVNSGNLAGLSSVPGDLTQADEGSLMIEVGSDLVVVQGAAELSGALNVSLAEGFAPTPGTSYQVLTASSVTDMGLQLEGAAASMFSLDFSSNSVSLVASAVPEPSTCLLMAGLVVGGGSLLRKRSWACCACLAMVATILALTGPARAETLTLGPGNEEITYRDDFDVFFDYYAGGGNAAVGTLTSSNPGLVPNKSWTGAHNHQNGGDPGNAIDAVFEANGQTFDGIPKPGLLLIEDLGLNQQSDGTTLGVGWEGDANTIANAPFLYANVDAGNNFQATMKIDAQTAGFWSTGGMVARLEGPGIGADNGTGFEPTESYVSMGAFRVTEDDPETPDVDESLTADPHTEVVENGVGSENLTGGAFTGLPIYLRMSKQASQFTFSTSEDNVTWTDRHSVVNAELNTPGELLEVGPSYFLFPNPPAQFGIMEVDWFEVTVQQQLNHTESIWAGSDDGASGDWMDGNNWDSPTNPGVVPNANTINVFLSNANETAGPATAYTNESVLMRSLTFDSANKYALSGAGDITLEPDVTEPTEPTRTFINVAQGSHAIQIPVTISSAADNDNDFIAAAGSELDLNNLVEPNGKRINVQGAGTVNFNSNLAPSAAGTIFVAGGNVGGTGRTPGALTNGDGTTAGGTVSPGGSTGTLTVGGTFNQHASGTLAIELGGYNPGESDLLAVEALALLDGLVSVSYANDFVPQVGDMFTILTAGTSLVNSGGIELDPSDTPYYNLIVNAGVGGNVMLEVTAIEPMVDLIGDYNGDNVVDAADYTLWRDNLGGDGSLLGANRDPANSGPISEADYQSCDTPRIRRSARTRCSQCGRVGGRWEAGGRSNARARYRIHNRSLHVPRRARTRQCSAHRGRGGSHRTRHQTARISCRETVAWGGSPLAPHALLGAQSGDPSHFRRMADVRGFDPSRATGRSHGNRRAGALRQSGAQRHGSGLDLRPDLRATRDRWRRLRCLSSTPLRDGHQQRLPRLSRGYAKPRRPRSASGCLRRRHTVCELPQGAQWRAQSDRDC